ncbi:hypothetical protein ACS0TY_024690 [Phlomoides rotata]
MVGVLILPDWSMICLMIGETFTKRRQRALQEIEDKKVARKEREILSIRSWTPLMETHYQNHSMPYNSIGRKEGRRNENERHKLHALNQHQKMVLQRKTEEVVVATKRLKELLEARKPSARENSSRHFFLGYRVVLQNLVMGFNKVYKLLQEIFPQIDTRVLRAVAIEHNKDVDAAVETIRT